MFHLFKKKEIKEGVIETEPKYCIESSINSKFKVCLDITNKTLICSITFNKVDILKEYGHIINNDNNTNLLDSIQSAMVASMKDAVYTRLCYRSKSVVSNDDGIRVFLEPDSFSDIELHIIAVAKIVKEKLDIMITNVSSLNDTIKQQLEISKELETYKSMYLTKAVEEANGEGYE